MTRRHFTRLLAAAGTGRGALGGCASGAPATEPSLDALARAKGLRFGSTLGIGSAGRASRFHDLACREPTAHECSVRAVTSAPWQGDTLRALHDAGFLFVHPGLAARH